MSRVTALCWAQAFRLWVLDQPAASKNRPTESLLVGRLDGSLCWLQVTMQEIDLHVKSTELTHCHWKEGKKINTSSCLLLSLEFWKCLIRSFKRQTPLIYPSSPMCCMAQWGQAFCCGLSQWKGPFGHNWNIWEWTACRAISLPGLFTEMHSTLILVAVCLITQEFSARLLCSHSFYSAGQHEFNKMGPYRTLAALHGQVRSSEDTGTHWRHLGDPPLPHAHKHR